MRELEQRTGVHREVIRIMIREGLLPEPKRPARNSAEYDEAHVRGIAAVRELQQSSRMTLKEIKAVLDEGGLDSARPAATSQHLDSLLAGLFGLDQAPPVSLSALAARMPHAYNDAAAFAELGMLELINTPEGGTSLTLGDARLVEIWGAIREAGFVEETGFPPDNIAFYLDAAKGIARREAEIFFGNSKVTVTEEQAARMLHIALPLMLDFFGLLRLKAFMQAVKDRSE
jgi:DNA-binding transcriptional MerR regulator